MNLVLAFSIIRYSNSTQFSLDYQDFNECQAITDYKYNLSTLNGNGQWETVCYGH